MTPRAVNFLVPTGIQKVAEALSFIDLIARADLSVDLSSSSVNVLGPATRRLSRAENVTAVKV